MLTSTWEKNVILKSIAFKKLPTCPLLPPQIHGDQGHISGTYPPLIYQSHKNPRGQAVFQTCYPSHIPKLPEAKKTKKP